MQDKAHSAAITRRTLLGTAVSAGAVLALPGYIGRASAQGEIVHFGASLPLTGTYEKVARVYRDAYYFWEKTVGGEINVGGRSMAVKWTIYDDENNASRTAQLTEKLISDDQVHCIVGAYGTDTVLAQGAIASRHGRALVQAGAASIRVDEEIGGHTAFTLVGSARNYYKSAIDYLATVEPKPKTLGLLVMDDPVYHEHAAGIRERCEAAGIEVVVEAVLPMNAQDFRPAALKFKSAGDLDIIASPAWDVVCIKLAQEMATLAVQPKAFIGGHLTTNPVVKETLGGMLREVLGATLWTPGLKYTDPHFASPQAFAEGFEAEYGYAPTYHAAMAYSIPLLYELVLKDADPADPFNQDRIKQALLATQTESVWGPISFNDKGRIQREVMPVIQWQGEDPEPKVVYPAELADAQGIYPKATF